MCLFGGECRDAKDEGKEEGTTMLANFLARSQDGQEKTLEALFNESMRVQELESKLKLSSTSLSKEIKKNYLMQKMLLFHCFKKPSTEFKTNCDATAVKKRPKLLLLLFQTAVLQQ